MVDTTEMSGDAMVDPVTLEYDVEIRRVICTTNASESINARYRRAFLARGHFPNEQAASKCLYLVTRSRRPRRRRFERTTH